MIEPVGTQSPFARELAKLRKINAALMSRVERSMDQQSNAFTLFETAIALDAQVRRRTQELQQALRSLERSNEALFRSKRQIEASSSSKSNFLTLVSHDLLQPLNAARLALSALMELETPSVGEALITQVDRALVTLEDLIRTLLDISKLDAGVLKPDIHVFPVNDILEPLAQECAYIAQKRNLRLRIRPCSAMILSDPLMLRRILQNLMSNALRYTRRGGVLVGCRPRGDRLRIDVVDTGPGIAPHRREAIFEEFQRDDIGGESVGFGLGLAIVRRLAFAMDHPIDLNSRLGRGSTFSVSPLRDLAGTPRRARVDARNAYIPGYGLGGAVVLLIENEPSVTEAMEALLGRWGCSVVTVSSADEAIDRIRRSPFMPALMIADLHLDGGECGLDVVEILRGEIDRCIPAFVITADHSEHAAVAAVARGFQVLKKPVKPAELRSLMTYLLS